MPAEHLTAMTSPTPPQQRPARTFRASAAEGIALFVLVLAAIRVVGWFSGAGALLRPPLGTAPMQFATAASFVATGVAMIMAGRGRQRGAQSISVGVLCAMVVFIALYFLDLHVGGGALPMRLPPESVAFAFALVHAGLLARCVPEFPSWARHAVMACGLAAALIVLEAVAEQAAGGSLRASHPVSDIASETMLLFGLIALALWASAAGGLRQQELDGLDRVAAWGTVLLAACVFFGWSRLESDFWRERIDDTTTARNAAVSGIAERLASHALALERLAERWDLHGTTTQDQFVKEARMYLRDRPSVQGLLFAGPDHVVRWHIARQGSGGLVGTEIGTGPGAAVYAAAAQARAPRLTALRRLHSGHDGVVIVAPVYSGGALRGYLTASLQLADFLKQSGNGPILQDFSVSLRDRNGRLLAGDPQDGAPGMSWLRQATTIDALGQPWTVNVWPVRAYLTRMRSGLPDAILLVGLVAVGIVAAAFVQARRSALHNLTAQRVSQRLATTLESITDAFFTLDPQMRFSYVNTEAQRLLQRARGELLGRLIWDEFPAALGTAFETNYRRALAEHCTVAFEAQYAPLGTWFNVKAYPSPEGLAVYFQDVTQRRRSQDALRESERELRALAESMPQIVWMADVDGATNYCNQRWLEFTGLTSEQTRGSGWTSCVDPQDLQRAIGVWSGARARGSDFELECRLRGRDGQYRWMLVRGVPHRDADGRLLKWLGTCTDVDAMKQSADAVRASEERFQLLARATNDGIWEWNAATGRLWWSEGFEALFGVHDREHASIERSLTRIHPDDRERTVAQLRAAMASGAERWSAEYRFMRADGTFAHVLNRGYVIRDAQARAVRIVGGMSDISERVALEEQLRQSQRLEAVGHLTGGLAHDFNNLLTVVLGNAETLSDSMAQDAQLRPLADMIVAAAERGADLTRRLLAFSRQEALAPVAIDLHRQIAELEPLLRRTLGEHIEMRLPAGGPLWDALVDPSRFDSALLNLCLNARDAMPYGGELTIEAANAVVGEEEAQALGGIRACEYVRISVTDNGCGIRPEHMSRLFEPFFTTKEKGKGTGLGLPMVYGFIKQSGGHVHVRSEPAQGTTVTLYLPRATGESPPAGPALAPASRGREAILLVEDDFYVRTYARDQLRALGYRVTEAGSGAQALEMLRGPATLDLLLTDVVMPQMSGPELASLARGLRPGLKVLFTSGYTEDALSQHGRLLTGVRLLAKPYLRDELARRVREALSQEA
ncbi:MAG TPA: PAS domain S-box protein [Ramlibacter sp.]|nr:PAS domain S-box protein [Ramlibacter sp.]